MKEQHLPPMQEQHPLRRPRSSTRRPRSAGSTTRTQNFFAQKDEEATSNKQNAAEDDGEEKPIFSLLDNDNEWEMIRTIRPQIQFDDMQFSVSQLLAGRRIDRSSSNAEVDSKILFTPQRDNNRGGPIGFVVMLYSCITTHLITLFSNINNVLVREEIENESSGDETKEDENDSSQSTAEKRGANGLVKKSSNVMRMEARILRELASEENKSARHATVTLLDKDKATPSAKIDESFSAELLVGPSKLSGKNNNIEIELVIQVDQIKFSTGSSEEEKAPNSRVRVIPEKFFVRLLINGKTVGNTNSEKIDSSFSVRLSHRFNVVLSQKPTSACLQIWKASRGFFPNQFISTCAVTVQTDSKDEEQNVTFPLVEDVMQFSSNDDGSDLQRREGLICISTKCKVRPVETSTTIMPPPLLPPLTYSSSKILIKPPAPVVDVDDAVNNRQNKKISYCPRDRQSMMAFTNRSGISFSDTAFMIEEPLRHLLIKQRLRGASVPSPIPINEQELQNSSVYQGLIREDEVDSDEIIISNIVNDRAAIKQQHVLDILKGIKEYSRQQSRRKKHYTAEIIQDVGRCRFANDNELEFPAIFERRRNLFPESTTSVPVISPRDCSLLLTIVGGKNVPMQLDRISEPHQHETIENDAGELLLGSPIDAGEDIYLGTLVKVKFRGKTYQTKAVTSTSLNPQWKETILLPLDNMIKKPSSILGDEAIEMTLFDSTVVDYQGMGGFYEDEETKTAELRYLGHASLPLSSILRGKGMANGFVHCTSPDIVLGYTRESITIPLSIVDNTPLRTSSNTTSLRIHATTEPFAVIPPKCHPDHPSGENRLVLARLNEWGIENPNCHVMWPDKTGNTFLISRFLAEQAPPPAFDNLASCAHYVSLLPLFRAAIWKSLLEGRDENMVLTSQQSLNILAATRKEHAILLTNFFLYLSKNNPVDFAADVLLVVGVSIEEGETAVSLHSHSAFACCTLGLNNFDSSLLTLLHPTGLGNETM